LKIEVFDFDGEGHEATGGDWLTPPSVSVRSKFVLLLLSVGVILINAIL
jgi:hypothetical protein